MDAERSARPKLPRGRERRLLRHEEAYLVTAARAFEGSHTTAVPIASLIGFALETDAHRGELVAMRWEDVDRAKHVLKMPESKNDTPRSIPLSSTALRLLDALPRRFDGRVWGVQADSISQAFEQVVRAARGEYGKRSGIPPCAAMLISGWSGG